MTLEKKIWNFYKHTAQLDLQYNIIIYFTKYIYKVQC